HLNTLSLHDALPICRPTRAWSVAVATGESSSASMVPLQRRRLEDAVLDVRVLHARGRMPRLRGLVALAFGARASAMLDRVPGRADRKSTRLNSSHVK